MSQDQQDTRRCVIIPSYNSGTLLEQTVRLVLAFWRPVIVVMDGSTDGSEQTLKACAASVPGLYLIVHQQNAGKGAAVLSAMEFAAKRGFTHAAVFDADAQHEAADLPLFMEASRAHPAAMILGVPAFGPEAPALRIKGRRFGNWWTNLETLWGGIQDSLFGFRVYPITPSLEILRGIRGGRRFDFDTQLAVRLYWRGIPPLNIPTPVHYHPRTAGGVSHFRYFRDNLLLIAVHSQLTLRAFTLLPRLLRMRSRVPLRFP
jgi:hypothetical protein